MPAPIPTNLLTAISADTFGTGTYNPAAFNVVRDTLVTVFVFGIQETDAGMEGSSINLSDSAGNTWIRIGATTNSPGWSYGVTAFYTFPTSSTSTTLSLTTTGALNIHSWRVVADQWDIVDSKQPIGIVETSSTATGGAATLRFSRKPNPNSYVIGLACIAASAGNISATPGTNFTEVSDANSASWAGYHVQRRTGSVSNDVSWVDIDATGTAVGSALLAFEIRGLEFTNTALIWAVQYSWTPERWDFPLDQIFLFDDFLPSTGGGPPPPTLTLTILLLGIGT